MYKRQVLFDPNNWKKFFEARHSIPDNALTKTQRLGGVSIITDTIVPKDNFRLYLDKVHSKLKNSKIEYLLFGHLGDCHLHFHLIPNNKQEKESLEIYDYLIDLSSKLGGVYSADHGTGKRKINDFNLLFFKVFFINFPFFVFVPIITYKQNIEFKFFPNFEFINF